MNKEKRIIAVGDSIIDYYDNIKRWYPTGNCVDFSVILRSFNTPAAIITMVGTDRFGDAIIDLLKDRGVEYSHVHRKKGSSAKVMMTLAGESGKDRTYLESTLGVYEGFDLSKEDLAYIDQFNIVQTTFDSYLDHWLPRFKEMGKEIIYDFSTEWSFDQHLDQEKYVDYGFFSYTQRDQKIEKYLKECCDLGMNIAVATFGDKGSLVYDGKKFYTGQIIPCEHLVNTVGAGDSFIAGFMDAFLKGWGIEKSIKNGAAISSKIVSVFEPYLNYIPQID